MASQAAVFAETIAAMKKAVKRKAYGMETLGHLVSLRSSTDYMLLPRLRFRQFDRTAYKSREQTEEESNIRPRRSTGSSNWSASLQKSMQLC